MSASYDEIRALLPDAKRLLHVPAELVDRLHRELAMQRHNTRTERELLAATLPRRGRGAIIEVELVEYLHRELMARERLFPLAEATPAERELAELADLDPWEYRR